MQLDQVWAAKGKVVVVVVTSVLQVDAAAADVLFKVGSAHNLKYPSVLIEQKNWLARHSLSTHTHREKERKTHIPDSITSGEAVAVGLLLLLPLPLLTA